MYLIYNTEIHLLFADDTLLYIKEDTFEGGQFNLQLSSR